MWDAGARQADKCVQLIRLPEMRFSSLRDRDRIFRMKLLDGTCDVGEVEIRTIRRTFVSVLVYCVLFGALAEVFVYEILRLHRFHRAHYSVVLLMGILFLTGSAKTLYRKLDSRSGSMFIFTLALFLSIGAAVGLALYKFVHFNWFDWLNILLLPGFVVAFGRAKGVYRQLGTKMT